jgi:hypothetical protein
MTERTLGQVQAAKLVGCSRDTISRARRAGRFPGARLEEGRWTIPVDDLLAAGLLESSAVVDHAGASSPAQPNAPAAAVVELARAEARIAGLEALVARQDDELRFLRLTVETLATRSAS